MSQFMPISFSLGKYIKTYWDMGISLKNNIGICFCGLVDPVMYNLLKIQDRSATPSGYPTVLHLLLDSAPA